MRRTQDVKKVVDFETPEGFAKLGDEILKMTRTLPLEIYLQSVSDQDAAIALSLVLVVIAVVITVLTAKLSDRALI